MKMLQEPTTHEKQPVLPEGWQWVRLSQVCTVNPPRPEIVRADDAPTTFVSMAAVEEGGRGEVHAEAKPFGSVRKGYTYFGEGDVIFAKITPCMQNGKQAIVRNLIGGFGFGSTEFHVLRPGADITSEWLQHYIAQPWVLGEAKNHFTGSVGQQRVPASFLANLNLPLPPISEQKRIVALLTQKLATVDNARAAAEAQLNAIKQLPPAYLRMAFSSSAEEGLTDMEEGVRSRTSLRGTASDRSAVTSGPVKPGSLLPNGWKWVRLGEVCSITARQVDPKIAEFGALPHVNGENILSGLCRMVQVKTAAEDGMTSGKYLFKAGDVLYSKLRPYLRKAVVADFAGVCSADVYPLQVDLKMLDPRYLAWTLVSDRFTTYADEESRRARMPKLNRDQLFSWQMPLPPLSEQRRIVANLVSQMSNTEAISLAAESQLHTINRLPAALLREAFTAQL